MALFSALLHKVDLNLIWRRWIVKCNISEFILNKMWKCWEVYDDTYLSYSSVQYFETVLLTEQCGW